MDERRDRGPAAALEDVLRARFGHERFVPPQREIIEHVLAGGDALVLMPTGGGKSLCYQLPALLLDGLTVVLSPLIALMQDQVDQLRRKGLPATFINSSLDRREREARLRQVTAGEVKLLYVTPERFRKPEFTDALARVEVALLAVDEAHCISAWGHDFRPEYGRVGRIRERLGGPPTIALTATATPATRTDVLERLGIPGARVFQTGIERRNLHVAVRPVLDDEERFTRVVDVIRRIGGPGIVYLALIRDLRALHDRLYRAGIESFVYHGDLAAGERRRMQRAFLDSSDAVVIATNAFGMGIDKQDIRFILHAQVPGSVEAWYQEIGRAGRDGAPSFCELLYLEEDLMIQQQFVEWANPDATFVRRAVDVLARWGDTLHARELQDLREQLLVKNRADGRPETVLALLAAEGIVEGSFERSDLRVVRPLAPGEEERLVHPEKRARDLGRLLEVLEVVRATTCRKRAIHAYFDVPGPAVPCGSCDVCADGEAVLQRFLPRPAATRGAAAGAPLAAGAWILVRGRHASLVQRVWRKGDGWLAQVQSGDDFRVRTIDLGTVPWETMER